MEKLTYKRIEKILEKYVEEDSPISKDNIKEIEKKIGKHIVQKAVLGIDIYRYSKYPSLPQTLIPHLFRYLYDATVTNCIEHEPYFFKNITKKSLNDRFIDTGDGGFQIFDNPFHAIIFAIYFQGNIMRYNSNHFNLLGLFDIIDEITLRYALTFDNTYSYEKNFFGSSIINCARIMSKDKLNRFLIDDNTKKWFTKELNGIENLHCIELEKDYKHIPFFDDNDEEEDFDSLIFTEEGSNILRVDLMKIGEIESKLDIISIHNLVLQIMMFSEGRKFDKYTICLGNINSNGLV